MDTYAAGTAVTVNIPLVDMSGNELVPVAMTYRVLDDDGVQIVALTSIPVVGTPTDVDIVVSAVANATGGAGLEARQVYLSVTTAGGIYVIEALYLLKASSLLVVPENTFQGYAKLAVEMVTMRNIENFAAASRDDQEASLVEAYYRLTRFAFCITEEIDAMTQISAPWTGIGQHVLPDDWSYMDEVTYLALPARFRRALARSQIAEANDILAVARPEDKRRAGLMLEKIGESSMMFRSGTPLNLGLSETALRYIGEYIIRIKRLERA